MHFYVLLNSTLQCCFMEYKSSVLILISLVLSHVVAFPHLKLRQPSSPSNTSVTLIYQNNLNASDDIHHVGALVLDPMVRSAAAGACSAFAESLNSGDTLKAHSTDFAYLLAYQSYAGYASPS